VVVTFKGDIVHITKTVSHENYPIWTVKTDSIFLLSVSSDDIINAYLQFELKVEAAAGVKSKILGSIKVDLEQLYQNKGDRKEFPLQQFPEEEMDATLAIRSRRAKNKDRMFWAKMSSHQCSPYKGSFSIDQLFFEVEKKKSLVNSLDTKHLVKKIAPGFNLKKDLKYRVRPGPDPEHQERTKWMTEKEINEEALDVSKCWVDIGSGPLAKIYLEIIGCDNLPNMDIIKMKRTNFSNSINRVGENIQRIRGDKTDACVAIVYEDAIARTDIINECLSPRWMPWTQRSFILNTSHASSKLYLAVYDLDNYVSGTSGYEFAGRVVINLANFHFKKEYLLHYKLRNASQENSGTITVRLRMECPDERTFMLNSLRLPKPIYLNVKSQKEYFFAKTALFGKDNDEFCLSKIVGYINEILLYPKILIFIIRAFFFILLWRGHYHITISIPYISPGNKISVQPIVIYLPLHSMTTFILGITLVEYPYLIFPYSFLTITWVMIAFMEFRNNRTPSQWYDCRTFRDFVTILILGVSSESLDIEPNQNVQESEEFMEEIKQTFTEADKELDFF